jgi:hypothetical protein
MWQMMHERLRPRIQHLLHSGAIADPSEQEKVAYLLKTKKWNPYCLRHSAITYDGDSLPEFGLRKKVRWSMNSRQPARYMKKRMGNNLKSQILAREGIALDAALTEKPAVTVCPKCSYVNAAELKACSECDWPFSEKVNQQIKMEQKREVEALREQLRTVQENQDRKLGQIMNLIRQNPKLANVKPEVLSDLEIRQIGGPST